MVHFGDFLKTWRLRSNSVTRQVNFNRTKIGGKCQNSNVTFWAIFPLTLNWWLISGKSMSNKGSGLCSRARVRTPSITIVIRWWFITRCRCRFWRRLWISSLCTWPTIKAKKSQGHTCCLTMATKGWPGVKLVNWLLNRSYATQLEALLNSRSVRRPKVF